MLFEVEGISCAKCSDKIHQALTTVDPTAQVEVDVDAGRVRVEGVLAKEQAIAALGGAGYPAKSAKPHSGAGSDCCGGCS
ncbi:heavy-metal-associated domain-containing protein [Lysobacter sp. GX 14042]|uniref:heavy-metal-associated domain-containing protein n=1 Tax=Lysobacter sp. GX 14042 TaxID=2907155 RepID=UPI001F39599C|nr:heavy-metal-associated domain-containing protein [Lysobacter sp. GX 14042]MCE7031234.1 heavy-metal-associated domain-containing protein [Lysobacter sp. GX 14042]